MSMEKSLDTASVDSLSDPVLEERFQLDIGDVARTTSGALPRHSSFKFFGSTGEVPFPEVLKEIALQELSGDLQVLSGRTIKTLYFDRGFVVFAGSNLKSDRLGQRLLESGKVTERELEMACRLMKGRRRIGEAMIEAGLLTEEELGQEVARQAKRIILSTFSLKNAIYSFDERRCIIPMDLRLGLSIYRILLEGTRRMSSGSLILQGLGSLHRRLCRSPYPPFTFEEEDLSSVERKVLAVAETAGALRELLDGVDENRGKALRAAYGMLCAGILEYADTAPREFKVQEETEAFLLSSLDKTSHPAKATNVRQEVLLQFDALESASPAELLDVDESAEENAIRNAYQERCAEWEKKQNIIDNEKSLFIKVEEIKRRLAAAHEALLEKRRFPPIHAGESPESETEVESDEDHDIEFEIDEVVEPSPVAQDDFDFDHPDESVDGDASVEEMRAELVDEPSAVASTRPARPAVSSKKSQTSAVLIPAGKKDEVKRLLYDIKVRMAVSDIEGAVSLMYELIELAPENAKYERMLADAMASHPVLNKKAERHYRRALSLDPQSADLHYRLGAYYQSFNMRSRALAEFKTTLRIDPTHSKARAGLVELKQVSTGPMEQLFKKFLG